MTAAQDLSAWMERKSLYEDRLSESYLLPEERSELVHELAQIDRIIAQLEDSLAREAARRMQSENERSKRW